MESKEIPPYWFARSTVDIKIYGGLWYRPATYSYLDGEHFFASNFGILTILSFRLMRFT